MKGKIKIRTMKDDLVNAKANAGSDNENKEALKTGQNQNKPDISVAKISGSGALPIATSDKLKDEEIGELKNLIEKISEENHGEKKDVTVNMTSEKGTSEQKERINPKGDEKKELKDLINKISETVEKKDGEKKEKTVQTENSDDKLDDKLDKRKEDEAEKAGENKQSFWSDISEKLKSNKSVESQRINAIKKNDQITKKSVDDIRNINKENEKEVYKNSGILTKEKEMLETKEKIEEKEEIRKKISDGNYQLPENRLIFGKQRKYSSVSKRIRLKDKKDEMEDLKSAEETKGKQKIISEKEKYKKLKNRVIKKYHVKLFSLPWIRIILATIVLVILSGAAYYILVKKLTPTPSEPPEIIVGTEIEKFDKIKNTLEFTKDNIVKLSFKESAISKSFELNSEVEELRIVIKDDGKIVSMKEALESMIIETEDFPNNFWETTTESYNILVMKDERNAFRFAIAIESNDVVSLLEIMGNWEQEDVDKRKMFNVFKPFFTDSRIEEKFNQHFEFTNYGQVYIRYINLPDKDTSFDYFANDNTLIVATSKESANRIINILDDGNYNDYDNY